MLQNCIETKPNQPSITQKQISEEIGLSTRSTFSRLPTVTFFHYEEEQLTKTEKVSKVNSDEKKENSNTNTK